MYGMKKVKIRIYHCKYCGDVYTHDPNKFNSNTCAWCGSECDDIEDIDKEVGDNMIETVYYPTN